MKAITLKERVLGIAASVLGVALVVMLTACGASATTTSTSSSTNTTVAVTSTMSSVPTKDSLTTNETVENSADGEHAIEVSGESADYSNVAVTKTGDSANGDEADFYGDNAAVFATDGATLNLSEMVIESAGKHANGVFSYGEGTTVNIADSVIETTGDCSGGLMTTGGGTTNASNLRITTSGRSSAAIRSDRGGGTVNVDGGVYTTSGTGSPVVYSTADITVSDAQMESTASQGVVVEGKNSVTLNDVELVADNNAKNSDKSDFYQAVMIYQSMSGDAASGQASFAMNGGSLTNKNGDVFFVNNTVANIDLTGASITNEDSSGVFLRAAAAGWGSEGSNGGQVILTASDQTIDGDMVVDDVSLLNLYLKDGSTFTGAINSDGAAGDVYVEIESGSTWKLTGDSWVTSLTCEAGAIDLNGYTLHVGDAEYDGASASTGSAIDIVVSESGSGGPGGTPPDGDGSGGPGGSGGQGGTPPEKPSGDSGSGANGQGGTPPGKPDDGKGGNK